jgi:hypothetical protein
MAVPSSLVGTTKTLSGFLGITTDQGVQAAAQAANFIPGVGPIISSVLQIGDAIFGGGDPTPLSQLISNIVNLRAQIAQANNAAGYQDDFTVPSSFNAQDKQGTAPLVEGIVEQALGVSAAHVQSNRRADYYAAIKALQSDLQQAEQHANNVQLTQQITQQVEQQLAPLQARQSSVGAPVSSLLDTSGSVLSPGGLVASGMAQPMPTTFNPLYAIGALAAVLLATLAFS